jgi:hypothetical protein
MMTGSSVGKAASEVNEEVVEMATHVGKLVEGQVAELSRNFRCTETVKFQRIRTKIAEIEYYQFNTEQIINKIREIPEVEQSINDPSVPCLALVAEALDEHGIQGLDAQSIIEAVANPSKIRS